MKKYGYAYILFFVAVLALQVLLLDQLMVSVWVAPIIYAACLIVLPLETPPVVMVCAGVVLGVVMDATMGLCGLNVAVTLPLAFYRRHLMRLVTGISDAAREEGVPTPRRMGRARFWQYATAMIALHVLLFFVLESFSLGNFGYFALRLVCSLAASLALTGVLLTIFVPKFDRR